VKTQGQQGKVKASRDLGACKRRMKKGNMTLKLIEAILLNVTLCQDVNNLDFQTFCDEN